MLHFLRHLFLLLFSLALIGFAGLVAVLNLEPVTLHYSFEKSMSQPLWLWLLLAAALGFFFCYFLMRVRLWAVEWRLWRLRKRLGARSKEWLQQQKADIKTARALPDLAPETPAIAFQKKKP